MKRGSLILIVLLVAIAAAFGWYRFADGTVPPGQPALATLDVRSLAALRADFNRDVNRVRIILLLSPT